MCSKAFLVTYEQGDVESVFQLSQPCEKAIFNLILDLEFLWAPGRRRSTFSTPEELREVSESEREYQACVAWIELRLQSEKIELLN